MSVANGRLEPLAGRRVLITGHTGFKGSWLTVWLNMLGAKVSGFALPPRTTPNNFHESQVESLVERHSLGDIRDVRALRLAVERAAPDVIFHLAAQPIVHEGYADPLGTFETNVMGTVNLLEVVRQLGVRCAIVIVSSDKCYQNVGQTWGYRECDSLGGDDPYSASKAGTEIVTASYRASFFEPQRYAEHGVALASARAGNVLGGGDWSPGRVMTDVISHLRNGQPVPLRNPNAVRPWQHVLETIHGYLLLASRLLKEPAGAGCSSWNFGPPNASALTVRQVVEIAIDAWGSGAWHDVSTTDQLHEAQVLRLANDKAVAELGWLPRWSIREAIERTVGWFRDHSEHPRRDMLPRCQQDITDYLQTRG